MTDSILDELFHGCALTAFLEQAALQQGWPDPEATRRRAYRLYEDALAGKNHGTRPPKRGAGKGCGAAEGAASPGVGAAPPGQAGRQEHNACQGAGRALYTAAEEPKP
jgi:hypothetical protein